MDQLKRTAIVYDFDGTLARGNIQERTFIPEIAMTPSAFWALVKQRTREHDADEILIYMQVMLERARAAGFKITADKLRQHGSDAALFDGLKDQSWFNRIDEFARQRGLLLEHYIVSSGIQEMIEGCSISNRFKHIYASKYIYNDHSEAEWPGIAINYTTKTQFLFRINKGIENVWDNVTINAYMPDPERPVPFSRMIFLGDGETDIPTMKMMTHQGGWSIAIYDPNRDRKDLDKIHKLISDGRVSFVSPGDYTENSQLDILVQGILGRIARSEGYRPAT